MAQRDHPPVGDSDGALNAEATRRHKVEVSHMLAAIPCPKSPESRKLATMLRGILNGS